MDEPVASSSASASGIYPDYSGIEELELNERNLPRYNRDVTARLTRFFHPPMRLLDFGAGMGKLALLCNKLTGVMPDCLEIDPSLRQLTEQRGLRCYPSLEEVPQSYDGIYAANVLEHVEHDAKMLSSLRAKLAPNGVLAIYVPAFLVLFGEMDRKVGHFRRYRRDDRAEQMRVAGFTILECRYVDSLGFFAWLAVKFMGYKKGNALGSESSLRFYDSVIYPFSHMADALGMKYLFGKNLLLIGRKKPD